MDSYPSGSAIYESQPNDMLCCLIFPLFLPPVVAHYRQAQCLEMRTTAALKLLSFANILLLFGIR